MYGEWCWYLLGSFRLGPSSWFGAESDPQASSHRSKKSAWKNLGTSTLVHLYNVCIYIYTYIQIITCADIHLDNVHIICVSIYIYISYITYRGIHRCIVCTIHVSACRYIAKLKNIDSGQNAILKHTDKIRGRKKNKETRGSTSRDVPHGVPDTGRYWHRWVAGGLGVCCWVTIAIMETSKWALEKVCPVGSIESAAFTLMFVGLEPQSA